MANWAKVWSIAQQGIGIAGIFDPRIKMIENAIHSIQDSIPENPGANKKATVEAISDAAIATDLAGLSDGQQAQFKALRSTYIDLYVTEQKAIADALASRQALKEFIDSVKASRAA